MPSWTCSTGMESQLVCSGSSLVSIVVCLSITELQNRAVATGPSERSFDSLAAGRYRSRFCNVRNFHNKAPVQTHLQIKRENYLTQRAQRFSQGHAEKYFLLCVPLREPSRPLR